MTRDYTTGLIANLRTAAAHPQLGDCYKRVDGDMGTLYVFEVARLSVGTVMVGMQAEGGVPRVYVDLVDLAGLYESVSGSEPR